MTSAFRAIIGASALVLASTAPALAAVDPAALAEIRAIAERKGSASVIVAMAMTETAESARAMERAQAAPSPESRAGALAARRERIAAAGAALERDMAAAGIAINRRFENLPFVTASVDAADVERLARIAGVAAVHPNRLHRHQQTAPVLEMVAVADPGPPATDTAERTARAFAAANDGTVEKALLSTTVNYIGADRAWNRGFTGRGVAVAVLDDGIDRNHDMFLGKIVAEACFSDRGNASDQSLCPNGATSSLASGAASTGCGGRFSSATTARMSPASPPVTTPWAPPRCAASPTRPNWCRSRCSPSSTLPPTAMARRRACAPIHRRC
jgi:subtilisin family serine protease